MTTDTTTATAREVVMLDPTMVEPHPDNARKKLRDIEGLTASVKAMGVIQPITVKANPVTNGHVTYQVIAGHRRRAAAMKAGVDVPAIVLDEREDAQAIALIMLTENEARDDLSTAERVRAVQVALDLGASLDDVAEATGVASEELTHVAKLHETPVAVGLAERHDLTLEQAMVMAEFADDNDVLKTLTKVAVQDPDRWDHEVAWIRRRRDERLAAEQVIAKYTEQGATFVSAGDLTKKALPFRRLVNPKTRKHLTEAQHAKCPHRVVVAGPEYEGGPVKVTEWCADAKAGGHGDSWSTSAGTQSSTIDDSPEAETEREAKAAERKKVLANNRALDVANGVRREYVTKLLARAKVTGSAQFVNHVVLFDHEVLSSLKGDVWAALTGIEAKTHGWTWRGDIANQLLGKTPTDVDRTRVTFGLVVAAIESTLDKTSWRNPTDQFVDYLTFLAGTGYTLSDIEAEVVKTAKGKGKRK